MVKAFCLIVIELELLTLTTSFLAILIGTCKVLMCFTTHRVIVFPQEETDLLKT